MVDQAKSTHIWIWFSLRCIYHACIIYVSSAPNTCRHLTAGLQVNCPLGNVLLAHTWHVALSVWNSIYICTTQNMILKLHLYQAPKEGEKRIGSMNAGHPVLLFFVLVSSVISVDSQIFCAFVHHHQIPVSSSTHHRLVSSTFWLQYCRSQTNGVSTYRQLADLQVHPN